MSDIFMDYLNNINDKSELEYIESSIEYNSLIYNKEDIISGYKPNEYNIYESSSNGLFPIYAIIFSNDTTFGKLIRKVTGSPYSHATVSLDATLNEMYSFSDIPYNHDKDTSAGFVRESLWSPMFQDNRYFTVFVTFTDAKGIKRFNDNLRVFKNSYTKYDYNDIGLLEYLLRMKNTKRHDIHKKLKWFCSEFVSYMLYSSTGIEEFKDILQSPDDLSHMNNLIKIGQYSIPTYNENDVINKTRQVEKIFLQRQNKYTEESYEDFIECASSDLSLDDKYIMLEFKNKQVDFVQNEKDVNKYTQLIDWRYLYNAFINLFPDVDPNLRFGIFEIIVRDYIVPLKLKPEDTVNIIVSQLNKINNVVTKSIGKIIDVSVPDRSITATKNNKTYTLTYPDFKLKY